jgi:hypothetical protein
MERSQRVKGRGAITLISLVILVVSACRRDREETGSKIESPPSPASAPVELREPREEDLVAETLKLAGESIAVRHSKFDMGSLPELFNGNWEDLARTTPTKTAIVELEFPTPRPLKGIRMKTAAMDVGLTVRLFLPNAPEPKIYTKSLRGITTEPTVDLNFDDNPGAAQKLRIELKDLAGGDGHLHIREIQLN